MNIKRLILFLFFLILFFSSPKTTQAQVLFSDNFDDGNSTGWIVPRDTCSFDWNVSLNKYGITTTNNCITETIPSSLSIGTNTSYSFEVDMTMTGSLNDRNFVFKYRDSNNWYGIHTYQNTFFVQKVVNGTEYFLNNWLTNYNFVAGNTYHFKIDIINNTTYNVYIDGILQSTVPDTLPYFDNYSAGLQASGNSQVWFDNVLVTEIISSTPSPVPTASPTVTPSPSPTVTPSPSPSPSPTLVPTPVVTATPTPTQIALNVPSLKQYSLPWKNRIYDHTRSTIHEFGCALTSAVMILQYHGHDIVPNVLNDWLSNQPDGYISNGLINWLAVSRYTKLHDTVSSPTLEYKRLLPTNENLINELENNRPAILKEPGHFVVAKSITDTSFGINDPGYANRNDLIPYGNSFLAINTYKPTHSDLSYMMFVTNPNINLELLTDSGSVAPTENYIDEPITSILNPNKKSGSSVKITLFEKPTNGKYDLKLSGSNGNYNLDSYLYDLNGKVTKNKFSGNLRGNDTDTFNINYEGRNKITEKPKKSDFKFWYKYFWKYFKNWHYD